MSQEPIKDRVPVRFRHPDGSIMTMQKGMSAADAAKWLQSKGLKITCELADDLFSLRQVH